MGRLKLVGEKRRAADTNSYHNRPRSTSIQESGVIPVVYIHVQRAPKKAS